MSHYQLHPYLDGCFSILITGERGTGKSRLVDKGFNNYRIPETGYSLNKAGTQMLDCNLPNSEWELTLKKKLRDSNASYLILENIENLNIENQIILSRYLSTIKDGYYEVLQPVENIRSQIIATSSCSLAELYNRPNYYPLIDRIAQQVVELKPIRSGNNIAGKKNGLKEVWKEMYFTKGGIVMDYPDQDLTDEFYEWLDTLYLAGNYRDLQKIAIYIWRYLIKDPKTQSLLADIKEKFGPHNYEPASHFFKYNATADEILTEFKGQLAAWAEKKYPDTQTLLKQLDIAEKTLYNWKNKK